MFLSSWYCNVALLLLTALVVIIDDYIIKHFNEKYKFAILEHKEELHPVDENIIDQVFIQGDVKNTIALLQNYNPPSEYVEYMFTVCDKLKERFEHEPYITRRLRAKEREFFDELCIEYIINTPLVEVETFVFDLPINEIFMNDNYDFDGIDTLMVVNVGIGDTFARREPTQETTPEQELTEIKEQNDEENVHERAVIDSSKKILKQNKNMETAVSDIKGTSIELIEASSYDDKDKKKAINIIGALIQNNDVEVKPYNMTECEILRLAVAKLEENSQQENIDYFVCELIDMEDTEGEIAVCPTGRSVRLIDVLAYLSEENILPDHVIKEMALNNLREQCEKSDNKEKIHDMFQEYIDTELLSKGLIDGKTRDEYLKWVDCV